MMISYSKEDILLLCQVPRDQKITLIMFQGLRYFWIFRQLAAQLPFIEGCFLQVYFYSLCTHSPLTPHFVAVVAGETVNMLRGSFLSLLCWLISQKQVQTQMLDFSLQISLFSWILALYLFSFSGQFFIAFNILQVLKLVEGLVQIIQFAICENRIPLLMPMSN